MGLIVTNRASEKPSGNCEPLRHILLVLIAGIGDLVLASKSVRAIRNGFPDAIIHLLTNTDAASIAKNYRYVDHVWSFPIRELRKDRLKLFSIFKLIRELRNIAFDRAVNLYRISSWSGALKMGTLFCLLNARSRAGHNHKGFGLFINKKTRGNSFQERHLADAMMEIAQIAGGIPDNKGIEVFWGQDSEKTWQHLFSGEAQRMRIGVNPGGDRVNRRWNPDHYAMVADHLVESLDAEIILLGGPGEEHISRYIQSRMKHPVANLAGKLTLNGLVYVISKIDLLITNDSGPMHIAAALRTALVAIFGPEDPIYTRPYTTPDLYGIVHVDVDCRPCMRDSCDRPICLERIKPEEVIEKCVEILASGKGRAFD